MIIGIIGTGTIGTLLIDAFIASEAIRPDHFVITNKTIQKARAIANRYKRIKVALSNVEVVQKSDLIFICVKPKELALVFQEIQPAVSTEKCVVTVTSPLSEKQLDTLFRCSTARVIPSITNKALSGVSLITFGENCTSDWQKKLRYLLGKISYPIEIERKNTRIAADITSCGPGFISYLLQQFIKAAVQVGEIEEIQAMKWTEEMIIGFAQLLKEKHFNLSTLQEKVCVKGGITGEGILVLEERLDGTFEEMFRATNRKFKEDVEFVEEQTGIDF